MRADRSAKARGWYHPRALRRYSALLLLYVMGLAVYAGVAGERLAQRSRDAHYLWQAQSWLAGRVTVDLPAGTDDPAKVETVRLDDGTTVRGRRLKTRPLFRTTEGEDLPLGRVAARVRSETYVSFPPFPSVVFLPWVACFGADVSDVLITALIAGLILPLAFCLFLTDAPRKDALWLAVALAFGTPVFFASVQGRVWFTAHVLGVVLTLLYLLACRGARQPLRAGLFLAVAALTRTPLAFLFPLFLYEAWRAADGCPRRWLRRCLVFATPVLVCAVAAATYNQLRFDDPWEFGHRYLAVRQQVQIETSGLFSFSYLLNNLSIFLFELPDISTTAPYLRVSGHGLAVWMTAPVLLLLLRRFPVAPSNRAVLATVAVVAVPALLYQNTGWVQFGYRFALDYLPLLFVLLARRRPPLGRPGRALCVVGIAINLFGAVTFARYPQFYRIDAAAYHEHAP